MNFVIGLFLGLIIGIIGTAIVWMNDIKDKYNNGSNGKRA